MNSWLSLISNIGKLMIILSSPPPNYPALPIILIFLSPNHPANFSDQTVPTSNLVGTFGIVRRLGMVGIVRKVGMVEMVSWSTNVAIQIVDVKGKKYPNLCCKCIFNLWKKIHLNLLEFAVFEKYMTNGWTGPQIDTLMDRQSLL